MRVFLTLVVFVLWSMTSWGAEFEEDSRKIREIIDLNYKYRESGEVGKRLDFFSNTITSVYNGSIDRYEKKDLRVGFTKVHESTRTEIEVLEQPTILFSNDGTIAYSADATIVRVYDRNTG